jgi:glycosyltransferase involved in cell wall biosynthesis
MPFYSVIVPVYNTKKYLPQCLDSLLIQEFKDCEFLLIDDGSTDGSGTLCDEYMKRDSRIKVIHQENRGLGEARNTGLANATGEWILFLDSDDYWNPTALQEVYKKMQRFSGEKLYVTEWCTFSEKESEPALSSCAQAFPKEGVVCLPTLQERTLFYDAHCGWAVWKLIVHRSIIQKEPLRFLPEVRNGEDLYWVIHLLERINTFCFLNTILCCYRKQEKGTLSESSPENALRWLDSLEKTIAQIKQESFEGKEFALIWLANIDMHYLCMAADAAQKKEWCDRLKRHTELLRGVRAKAYKPGKAVQMLKFATLFGTQCAWNLCVLFKRYLANS